MKERIEGVKVILRRPTESDAAFFMRWYNEPEVMAKCGFVETTTLEKEAAAIRRHMESKDGDWYTITDKTGRIVGETGLLRMFPAWRCTDLTLIIPDPNDSSVFMRKAASKRKVSRNRGISITMSLAILL